MDDPFQPPNGQTPASPPQTSSSLLGCTHPLGVNASPSLLTCSDLTTPVRPEYCPPTLDFESTPTTRPSLPRSHSSLRAQASSYVPASQRSSQRSSSDSSYHTALSSQSLVPTMTSKAEMAATSPDTSLSRTNAQSQRGTGESTVQQPVAGAMTALNTWNLITPNASFKPPSTPWASTVKPRMPLNAFAIAGPDTPKTNTSTVNTPRKATPTPIIVTPPRGASKTQSEGRSGAKSPNWRSRVRSADRSRSPLAQRSETSSMPVPMLYRHTSRSPRRSTTPNNGASSPKPSVKHLTCWWFHEKGQCRYSDEECLYAHFETGLVADAPRQIQPGGPALAGKGLERALRRIASESGSLNSSPPRSRPPSEAEAPGSAMELQNENIRVDNVNLLRENGVLRDNLKALYVSTSSMLNSACTYRRCVEATSREVSHIITSATDTHSQPLTSAGVALTTQRHLNQQRLQLQNQFHLIADVLDELVPRTKDCGAAEWGARASMTKVVLDIEKARIGWDLAAAVAQDGLMQAATVENNRPNNLSDVLENMRLRRAN